MSKNTFTLNTHANYEAMSEAAAQYITAYATEKPSALICAASGNSPRLMYDLLAQQMQAKPAAAHLKIMTLDEWVGIPQESPSSSAYQIRTQLTVPLGTREYFFFAGDFASADREILRAQAFLQQHGPIDLCILGVGTNGHLGLNEPARALNYPIHIADIAESTRGHVMVADLSERPTQGITLGLGDIMAARKILLMVNGAHKRAVMEAFFEQKISTDLPVSLLWLHPDVICFCDESACGGLA